MDPRMEILERMVAEARTGIAEARAELRDDLRRRDFRLVGSWARMELLAGFAGVLLPLARRSMRSAGSTRDSAVDRWLRRRYGPPPRPGEYLGTTLRMNGWSATDLAFTAGLPLEQVERLLRDEEPITPDVAERIAPPLRASVAMLLMIQFVFDRPRSRPVASSPRA